MSTEQQVHDHHHIRNKTQNTPYWNTIIAERQRFAVDQHNEGAHKVACWMLVHDDVVERKPTASFTIF
jgi:hypothetical protein